MKGREEANVRLHCGHRDGPKKELCAAKVGWDATERMSRPEARGTAIVAGLNVQEKREEMAAEG